MKHILMIIFCALVGGVAAQDTAPNLAELLDEALRTHPSMRVADLKIQQQQLLKNSGFELDKTNFYYTGQALGAENPNKQHDFGVSQSFSLPKVYRDRNALIAAETEQVIAEKNVTALVLKQEVVRTYWAAVARTEQLRYYDRLTAEYTDFLKWANLRWQTGEASKLEALAVQTALQTLDNDRQNTERERLLLQNYLGFLTGRNAALPLPDAFNALVLDDLAHPSAARHPALQVLELQKEVAAAKITVAENMLSPDFNVGYASQIFNGQAGLNLVQVGVSVPLHRAPQRQRIEAAKVEGAIVKAEADLSKAVLENELQQRFLNLQNLKTALDNTEKLLQGSLNESLSIAKKAYQAGELGYLEYLQLLRLAADTELRRLDLTQQYNQTIEAILLMVNG